MLKNAVDQNSDDFSPGLNTSPNFFNLEKGQTPNVMDVKVRFDGALTKRLGTNTQNLVRLGSTVAAGFLINSGGTLTNNLISFWKMDETAGERADAYGEDPLSDNNLVSFANGIKKNAATFIPANSQYLSRINDSSFITGDIDFSISTWVYLDTAGLENYILTKASIDTSELLLCHFNGANSSTSIQDSSFWNRTVTANGNAALDTSQAKFGSASLRLDGNGDYITVSPSSNFDFSTGHWTFEAQIRAADIRTNSRNTIFWHGTNDALGAEGNDNTHRLEVQSGGTLLYAARSEGAFGMQLVSSAGLIGTANWYHVAITQSGNIYSLFIDGVLQATTSTSIRIFPLGAQPPFIGAQSFSTVRYFWNGWIDEVKISNISKYNSNFTPPTTQFNKDYEYALFVNTDNIVTFRASSSGDTFTHQVQATSFGAVTTATWYNVQAWHDTGDRIGISVNLSVNTASMTGGLRAGSAPLLIGAISSSQTGLSATKFLSGRVDETGFWKKVLTSQNRSDLYNGGLGNTWDTGFPNYTWGSYDFGASNKRWYTVAAGTGVHASSDLGVNFTVIATDRSATYQHFERSKNVLVMTSDNYDSVLKWDGSGGTFATLLNNSAPTCRFAINHQGFLILLNSTTRKRIFSYEDENTQLTGDWADSFDIPSSQDDEITAAFVLNQILYVSTRYFIYRLTYVGGNPDWSYKEIKNWGFVPRTAKKITLKDIGEVIVGLSWDKRIRIFDGANDKIVSDQIELDNRQCDFSLAKLGKSGSGLVVSHAVVDENEQVYKLNVAIGVNSSETTHLINFDGRKLSFYPYQNQMWQTMCMVQSDNLRYVLAGDRSGLVHILDSGNLDANRTPIDDVYDSNIIFDKSPSEVSKAHKIDLYFKPTSSNTIKYMDRVDFTGNFSVRDNIMLVNTGAMIQVKKEIDVPVTTNIYQFRITSSRNTSEPWELNRTDYFNDAKGVGGNG